MGFVGLWLSEAHPRRTVPFSCLGYIKMGNEKIGVRRLEHHDLYGRVRLELGPLALPIRRLLWEETC